MDPSLLQLVQELQVLQGVRVHLPAPHQPRWPEIRHSLTPQPSIIHPESSLPLTPRTHELLVRVVESVVHQFREGQLILLYSDCLFFEDFSSVAQPR